MDTGADNSAFTVVAPIVIGITGVPVVLIKSVKVTVKSKLSPIPYSPSAGTVTPVTTGASLSIIVTVAESVVVIKDPSVVPLTELKVTVKVSLSSP